MSRFEPKVRWWSATTRSLSRFAPARRPHARWRLSLEYLEDRTMLSTAIPLTVTTLADDPTGVPISGYTTLRDAIIQADNDPANSYAINFSVTGTIDLTNPLPDLKNNIALDGPGASDLTVQRVPPATDFSVFTVDSGATVSISDLTISGGDAVDGGGIYNAGTLMVSDSALSNDSAGSAGSGGGINNYGGGIYNVGTLTVAGSTFSNNSAGSIGDIYSDYYSNYGIGGGIYNSGTATVTGSTFSNNTAGVGSAGESVPNIPGYGEGGGVDNAGTLSVTDSTFGGNSTSFGNGGGLYNGYSATVTVTDSTFSSNSALGAGTGGYGGGLDNYGIATVSGSIFTENLAGPAGYGTGGAGSNVGIGGGLGNGGTMTVTDSTFSNNTAGFGGGGLGNYGTLTVNDSTCSNNSAGALFDGYGGGFYNAGTLTANDSTFTNNSVFGFAGVAGGNDENYFGFVDLLGGGTMTNCTIGSIYGGGTMTNCTIGSIYEGGTLTVTSGGTLTVTNCTIGSIFNEIVDISGNLTFNSVIVNNTIVNNIEGPVQPTSAYNLIGTGGSGGLVNGTNGNQVGVSDLGLDPNGLQNNGGPTQTIALLPGSPALDAGSVALAVDASGNPLTTDQRGPGFPRVINGTVDIGAYEFTPLSQTISFGPLAGQTYGVAPITLSATDTSGLPVSFAVISGPATLSGSVLTVTGAGNVVIEASQAGNATYSAAVLVYESFTVSPVPLTITPTAGQSMVYGSTVPALTYTYTGLVNGDPASLLTGTLGTTAISTSTVGNYPFTLGSLTAGTNYALALAVNSPTFAVTPATLMVTANPETKVYGSPDPVLTYAVSGFQLSDTAASVLTGALTRTAGETVAGSPYAISQGTLAADANYTISFTGCSLTITPATPTITWANPSAITYGTALSATQLGATASWTVGGNTVNVPGSFTYNPAAGTVLSAGNNQTLSVSFTPTDTSDYTNATATASINVAQHTTTATLAASTPEGAPGQTITFTATVAGGLPSPYLPTGSVQFQVNGVNAGLPVHLANDTAAFSTVEPASGSFIVTAVYSGDTNFAVSQSTYTETVLSPGVYAVGTTLYVVGANTSDYALISPWGSKLDGSTGLAVVATLNKAFTAKAFNQTFTAIDIFGYGGNDTFLLFPTLTLPTTVVEGNGNNYVLLASGNDSVTLGSGSNQVLGGNGNKTITAPDAAGTRGYIFLGNGNENIQLGQGNDQVVLGSGNNTVTAGNGNDYVAAGNGNNTVTVGNGNDNVQLGNGSDVIVEGNGNDNVSAGNGSDLVVGGLGQHTIQLGNGNDILIDGSATVVNSSDSLRQILSDWNSSSPASVDTRLKVVYNTTYPNVLKAGSGRDWFFFTYSKDVTNKKSTDTLN